MAQSTSAASMRCRDGFMRSMDEFACGEVGKSLPNDTAQRPDASSHAGSARSFDLHLLDHPVLNVRTSIGRGRHAYQDVVPRGEIRLEERLHPWRDRRDAACWCPQA